MKTAQGFGTFFLNKSFNKRFLLFLHRKKEDLLILVRQLNGKTVCVTG